MVAMGHCSSPQPPVPESSEPYTSVFFGEDAPTFDELRTFFDIPSSNNIVQHNLQESPLHELDGPIYEDLASNSQGEKLDIFPVTSEPSNLLTQDFDISDPSTWTNMTSLSDWDPLGRVSSLPDALEISEAMVVMPVIAPVPHGQPPDEKTTIATATNSLKLPYQYALLKPTPKERQGAHAFPIHSTSNLQESIKQVNVPASEIPLSHGQAVGFTRHFGPSRPVKLPPARKGGRKGKLSAREKLIRMESRKQGACIRCRATKTKVSMTEHSKGVLRAHIKVVLRRYTMQRLSRKSKGSSLDISMRESTFS
jgi:hypothetical protein